MSVKIIGLIIGILILVSGIYYLTRESNDPESKKSTRLSASSAGSSQRSASLPCCFSPLQASSFPAKHAAGFDSSKTLLHNV